MVTRTNKSQDQDSPSKRYPLIDTLYSRSAEEATKDSQIKNMFVEKHIDPATKETNLFLIKRPGYTRNTAYNSTNITGAVRGFYQFSSYLWYVIGTTLYRDQGVTPTTIGTISGTGPVYFAGYRDGTNTYLIVGNGTSLWYVVPSTGALTAITDAQLPAAQTFPVVMDGYLFVIDAVGNIYNSDLNNVSSWSSQLIRPELYSDLTRVIIQHHDQLVAIGSYHTELFYDAGNTSSSPLSVNRGTSYQFGTFAPFAVKSTDTLLFIPAQSYGGGRSIYMMEGFQLRKISNEYIERILQSSTYGDPTAARGYTLRSKGHLFYIFRMTGKTFVYDVLNDRWAEWSLNNNGTHATFAIWDVAEMFSGTQYAINTTGSIFQIEPDTVTDNGTAILCEVTTKKYDPETLSRKFMHGMYFVANDPGSTATLTFKWSDDDYQNWSNEKTLDLHGRCFFPRLGTFRRRAFNFKCSANVALQWEGLEFVDMQTGNN